MNINDGTDYSGIVASVRGDVTGDKIADTVSLTGVITPGSPFTQYITLSVQDGVTGLIKNVPLRVNTGYNPVITLSDFTGDGIPEIMIGFDSGGSGGIIFYYIYSFLDFNPRLIFDFEKYDMTYKYTVSFLDFYRVEVLSRYNREKYIIDIQNRGREYLNEIYDGSGRLKAPVQGFVDPLSGLFPVDFNADGKYELLGYQGISGLYHADRLGYVLNTLSWENNSFILQNQQVAVFGYIT